MRNIEIKVPLHWAVLAFVFVLSGLVVYGLMCAGVLHEKII